MTSDPLKALLSPELESGEMLDASKELSTGTDRSAALLGGQLVANALMFLLLTKMRELSLDEINRLFHNEGTPLAGFAARTKVAYALSLIGTITRDDLDTLRKIRNTFAHSPRVITFETPAIRQKTDQFKCVQSLEKDSARARFIIAVRCLMIHLSGKIGGRHPGVTSLD